MSVVTNVVVTPNRIEALLRLLVHERMPVPRDVVRARLAPPTLGRGDEGAETGPIFAEARVLGLTHEDVTGLSVPSDLVDVGRDRQRYIEFMDGTLLQPTPAAERGQENFPYTLAWFLTFDPLDPPIWTSGPAAMVTSDTGRDLDIANDARFQQFFYWARFLGFAERVALGQLDVAIPDPTIALQRHLPTILGAERELTIDEFMRRWATFVPSIDGGTARLSVEGWMRERGAQKRLPEPGTLSPTTSLALNRLDRLGVLRLTREADATAMVLGLTDRLGSVSHVVRGSVAP